MIGRYFAMDRDHRWERVEAAWKLIFLGEGTYTDDPVAAVRGEYGVKKTDEFMPALVCVQEPRPLIADGDGILYTNFRGDRARQLCEVVLDPNFKGFPRSYAPKVSLLTMTQYDATFPVPVMYPPQVMTNLLGEVVAAAGKHQLRMAETEKYPHVTYFFNRRHRARQPRRGPRDGRVAQGGDLRSPAADERAGTEPKHVLKRLDTGVYDLLILNFANPDMVGHTGVLEAAIKAVETIDGCLKQVVEKVLALGGGCLITAGPRQLRADDQ